jgi:hypothetical protein
MTSVWVDLDAVKAVVGRDWIEAILFGDEAKVART